MDSIKLVMIFIIRFCFKIFYVFPLKQNRVYFSSNLGTSMGCNPGYLYKYMVENYPNGLEYVWEYNYPMKEKYDNTIFVRHGSLKSIYYLLTSNVIISNMGLGSYIPKRKNQCFINTWHGGGAYKRVGIDDNINYAKYDAIISKICGNQTDIFISSSEKFSEVMHKSKMVQRNKFLECGMPRNDILINNNNPEIVEKVKKYFGIESEKRILLFAPTYRGEEANANFQSELDEKMCLDTLKERFGGEWVLLIRKHHFVKESNLGAGISASDYPDMQELLYATDVFITDYSSTIWDYSLTFKPGFLFVPDIEQYGKERSFYTDPETWAFPLAKSNEELQEKILNYDEKISNEKILRHHNLLKSKETGHSTETVVNNIMSKLKGN